MKKLVLLVLIFGIILIHSCEKNRSYYREKELIHFLEQNGIELTGKYSTVLFLVGSGCGSCVESTLEILNELKNNLVFSGVAVIGNEDALNDYSEYLPSTYRRINTVPDTLIRRGLLVPSNMIFILDKDSRVIKYWPIVLQTKKEISIELKKTKYRRLKP